MSYQAEKIEIIAGRNNRPICDVSIFGIRADPYPNKYHQEYDYW